MAFTRLKNLKGQYCFERNNNLHFSDYSVYKHKGVSTQSHFPALGINMGNMHKGYYNNVLSNNPTDIESQLYGINSTNLVSSSFKTTPSINSVGEKQFFDLPFRGMPLPLIVQNNQRPNGPFLLINLYFIILIYKL